MPTPALLSKSTNAATILNPALDDKTAQRLSAMLTAALISPPKPSAYRRTDFLMRTISKPEIAMAGGASVIFQSSGILFPGSPVIVILGAFGFSAVMERRKDKKTGDLYEHAKNSYVRTEWLTEQHKETVLKAKDAVDRTLKAQVVIDGALDSRVLVEFPAALWSITSTLCEVSQILHEIDKDKEAQHRGSQQHREALEKVVKQAVRRTAHLVQCANDIAKAETYYRYAIQATRRDGIDERVMDLIVATSADAQESDQLKAISDDAAIVEGSYREAMDTALDSIGRMLEEA